MTIVDYSKIECSKCKSLNDVMYYPRVDLHLDPHLYDEIMEGKFFICKCEKCGHNMAVAFPCLVSDADKKYMVYLYSGDQNHLLELAQKEGNDYEILRQVKDYFQLKEKLVILSCGLNDKVMEIVKAFFGLELRKTENTFYRLSIDDIDEENNKLKVLVFFTDKQPLIYQLDYQNIYDKLSHDIKEVHLNAKEFECIDSKYSFKIMKDKGLIVSIDQD